MPLLPHLSCKFKPLSARHGFTLIELAVVLTIVGLIAGAVLATRSYIRSAQLTTMMNEAKIYQTAFKQFENKYGQPPGDYSDAAATWSGLSNGDGNGVLVAGTSNTVEYWYVWQHLAAAGLITGSYSGVSGSAGSTHAVTGYNIPASPIKDVGYMFERFSVNAYYPGNASYYGGYYGHLLRIGRTLYNGNYFNNSGFLTVKEQAGLDQKYDDGKPGTGWMRSRLYGASVPCVTVDANPLTATYDLTQLIPTACYPLLAEP